MEVDDAKCRWKIKIPQKVYGVIKSLVNAKGLKCYVFKGSIYLYIYRLTNSNKIMLWIKG